RPAAEIIEPRALEREAKRGEVLDRRGEVELAVEPRLDRVPVGRDHVFEMSGLEGANVPGDDLVGEPRLARENEEEGKRGGARGAEPEPGPALAPAAQRVGPRG